MKTVFSDYIDNKKVLIRKNISKPIRRSLCIYKVFVNNKPIDFYIDINDPENYFYRKTFNAYNMKNKWKNFYRAELNKDQMDKIEKIIYDDLYNLRNDGMNKIIIKDGEYYINIFNEYYIPIEIPETFLNIYPKYNFIREM